MVLDIAAVTSAAVKEASSLDKAVRNLANLDFVFKDAMIARSLRTLVDRLDRIFFSRTGYIPLLEKLANHQQVSRDEFRDAAQQFYASNEKAFAALAAIEKAMRANEIRFDEDFNKLVDLVVDVKTTVRTSLGDLLDEIERKRFSEEVMNEAARTAAGLIRAITVLNDSIRYARSKVSAQYGQP